MAHRVKTDIDLGQNNLLNGGFERVIALPLENNVLGRQVLYQGKPYWWNGTEWISWENVDPNQFWQTDKANAENAQTISIEPNKSVIDKLDELGLLSTSRSFYCTFDSSDDLRIETFNNLDKLAPYVRYEFILSPSQDDSSALTNATLKIPKSNVWVFGAYFNPFTDYYEISFSLFCSLKIIKIEGDFILINVDYLPDAVLTSSEKPNLLSFFDKNNIRLDFFRRYKLSSLLEAIVDNLDQLSQGGATGNFWSLTQANAETSACEVTINNNTESIFPQVLAAYGDYIHSRNIIVDLSNYSDESSYVFDLFGDISNVPTNVRYSIFITGYNGSLKLDFPKQYLTNISALHTPDGAHEESFTIAYSGATKIDFIKLGDNVVWVDVAT
jgi:hypothetical protein